MTAGSAPHQQDLGGRAEASRPASAPARAGAWRAWLSAVCIVVAAILVPVSIVAAWARVQLVDEDSFVAMLAPLSTDADVQAMIVDETMDAITAQVDFGALTSSVIDGVAALGLPDRAVSALGLLTQPAAAGLEGLVDRAVTQVVASDAFSNVWSTATRAAHRGLVTAATSDGGGLVVRTDDGVGIQLGAIVAQVRQNLTAQGVGIAGLIPAVDRVVILGSGENLALLRGGYAAVVAVGVWLPVVAVALLALGLLISRRRTTALLGSGIGLLVGAGLLAVGFSVGAALVGPLAADAGLSGAAVETIYAQLTDAMARTAVVTAVLGAVLALLAWSRGRWRVPTALRSIVAALNSDVRRALARRGLDTGAFGSGLYRHRALVGAGLVVLAVVWLALLRPLTFGDVVVVLLVMLAAWWLTELLQRRPDEAAATDSVG